MSVFNDIQINNDFYGVTANKGDLIVNDGVKNAPLAAGLDSYVLTADSTQPLGVKWAASTGGGSSSVTYNQYTLTSLPVATNSVTPVPITQFTSTPGVGNYVVMLNMTYSLSLFNRNATFGLYKNDVLVADTARTLDSFISFMRNSFSMSFIVSCNSTDIISVKFNTNNLDTNLTIHEGTLILIKFSNVLQYPVSGSDFITNYTSPTIIPNTINTPTLGIYLISFSCVFYTTLNRKSATIGFYKNSTLITGSERTVNLFEMIRTSYEYNHIVSFSGSDILDIRVHVSNIDTDIIISDRNLLLITL